MSKTLCLWLVSVVLTTVWADCGVRDVGEKVEVLLWPGGSWAGYTSKDYITTPNYLGHDVDKKNWNCPIDCRYTTDKNRLANADAVIYEAQPITSYYDDYKRHPPQFPMKYIGQHWINHGYETHVYFNLYGDPGYLDHIDGNMTFSQSSVVPITFTCNWGGGQFEDLLKPPPPKSKDKCIVMMATNCQSGGATFRTAYAKELMEYMDVHSFGRCLHNKDLPQEMQFPIYSDHGASMRNKVRIFRDYKFVLTMENNNITDYVTEKIMNVFQAGTVPVYMGAPNVAPDWIPGEHSIIKTDDFKGPKHLAEYLNFLCENDEEYYKYFEWKKKGFSKEFQDKINNCVFYGAECRLCQYLADQRRKLSEKEKAAVETRRNSNHAYYALKLTGQEFIEVKPGQADFDFTEEFTISAWIQLQDKVDNPIFTRGNVIKFGIKKIWKRGYAELCVLGECYYGSHPIILDSWTHVAVVYDWKNRIVKFYGNGVEDESVSIPLKQIKKEDYSENSPLLLAADTSRVASFTGYIDNISVWRTALSPEKAKKMVYGAYSGAEPGIVAFWSFDQLPGERLAAIDDVARIVGTLNGTPMWEENLAKPLVTTGPCL